MTNPLLDSKSEHCLLKRVFDLDPELLAWYENQSDITTIINSSLRQYRTHHCFLEQAGWRYQIKASYKLYVTDRDGIKYVCDISFDDFTLAHKFLQAFLIHESGGRWVTRNRIIFTNSPGKS